ncbi:hypothetical protein V6M85_12460 [Sulfolobus tengchongensis]|uniref:Transposase n=1 Tax=Sulfolobus tengchongensis TaxID=207809 RepID=A0AAX4KZV3_9CREN
MRNYIEEQGIQITDKLLHKIQEIAKELLKGVEVVDISIDWTGMGRESRGNRKWGKGISMELRNSNNDKIVILAFTPYTNGMRKDEIVKTLVKQVTSLGFKIGIIALDAGFYSVEVIRFLSQFKYIISVPVGDVKIYDEYDGTYTTRSGRVSG